MIHSLRVPAMFLLLASTACKGERAVAPIAPTIAQSGDTTFVSTPEPGMLGTVRLEQSWDFVDDPLHTGTIGDAALGEGGAVWMSVTGAPDSVAIYRVGEAGVLQPVARRGSGPDDLEGDVMLTALADGGVLAIATGTGGAWRFSTDGELQSRSQLRPALTSGDVHPDRHGGWFVRGVDGTYWLRHAADGAVTDTMAIPTGWATESMPDGIGRDGSLLRAHADQPRVDRRTGQGVVMAQRWEGPSLAGALTLAHDVGGGIWVGDHPSPDTERWHTFDRDGALQAVVTLPAGARALGTDGPYLLAWRQGAPAETGLVVWRLVPVAP